MSRDAILHAGQSQTTDMASAKPLALTVAWINRHFLELLPRIPRPDFVLPDVRSIVELLHPGTCL